MEIDVALLPRAARVADGAVLVVIDQIRASTTITTLLDLGCEDVVLAPDVISALALGHATDRLVAGEWRAVKPAAFDFDNSPVELARADLGGRGVVLCTTNGTAVLHRVRRARHVLVGCTRNASACAAAAVRLATGAGTGIRVICAGRHGRFVMDDAIAAGVIVGRAVEALAADGRTATLSDPAATAVRLRHSFPDLLTAMQSSDGGRTLVRIGAVHDVAFCAAEDETRTVPVLVERDPMRVVALPEGTADPREIHEPDPNVADRRASPGLLPPASMATR